MASRARLTLFGALIALGMGSACERVPTLTSEASDAPVPGAELATHSTLLELMSEAPTNLLHGGAKHYQAYWTDASGPQVLEYTEEVLADGFGNYSVAFTDLIQPVVAPGDETLFGLLQDLRQRLMFEYRDFALRDSDAFLANYQLIQTGQPVQVAGVTTERLRVELRSNPDRRYVLDVDPSTGLILRSREELLNGTLVSLSEFTSLDYNPVLTGAQWSEPLSEVVELVPGSDEAKQELGFQPREPKQIPAGWQRTGYAKLVDPMTNRIWVRMTYTDGVEVIFFLAGKGEGPTDQLVPAGSGPPLGDPDRVRKMSIGSWTLMEANLQNGDGFVLGRASETVMYDMIQSAFY